MLRSAPLYNATPAMKRYRGYTVLCYASYTFVFAAPLCYASLSSRIQSYYLLSCDRWSPGQFDLSLKGLLNQCQRGGHKAKQGQK